jgi:hypothetical protein
MLKANSVDASTLKVQYWFFIFNFTIHSGPMAHVKSASLRRRTAVTKTMAGVNL